MIGYRRYRYPALLPCTVMHTADLGDDVYGEDPTINELEELAATMLGKEAGLFAPSGTQSNLLALLTLIRGDEYIVGNNAYRYRAAGQV